MFEFLLEKITLSFLWQTISFCPRGNYLFQESSGSFMFSNTIPKNIEWWSIKRRNSLLRDVFLGHARNL